jgi:NRPS condensation-like uncharacterized protein
MTERFAVPDQLTCYYDRPAEPANVHLEVRVPGKLDATALRGSVQAVLAAEPRVGARRARTGRWRRSYYWEFPPVPDADPVVTATHADQLELDVQRDAFLSQAPPLDVAPLVRLLLTSGPGGDCLVLNAHHAGFDGLSCLRLLRGVAEAYGRRPGLATPASRPGQAAPASRLAPDPGRPGTDPAPGAVGHAPATARIAPGKYSAIARIAPGQARARRGSLPGYGTYLMSWDGLTAAAWLRSEGASVNDLLIAALMLTIGDWNDCHGGQAADRGHLIKITMPVGDRTQAGRDGQWANLSRLTSVTARVRPLTGPCDLLGEVARQTRYAKDHQGPQVDLASRALAAAPIPVAVKHVVLRSALRLAGTLLCDTSLVSNLGQIEAPAFGAMTADQVWFSTSAHMPRGLSLGAVGAGGRLALAFRYRLALFSGADAADFAGRFAKVLDQFTGPEAAAR